MTEKTEQNDLAIPDEFVAWQQTLNEEGADAALSELADTFKQTKEFHKLFEVRQMQVRRRMGLAPHVAPKLDRLPQEKQNDLEQGLLDACREVGLALFHEGQLGDGWMYLRALGEKQTIAKHLKNVRLDGPDEQENSELTEQAIHLALYEGIDPAWGLGLLLKTHGTCNSITALSGTFPALDRGTRAAAAATMVVHLHEEILSNLRSDMERRKLSPPANAKTDKPADEKSFDGPIASILATHPQLVAEQSYHVDLSHLSSTMQFARSTNKAEHWRLSRDLAIYGGRLSPHLVSEGEEPFVNYYAMHQAYFDVLLGLDIDKNLARFANRATSVDPATEGPQAAEVYVDLLARMSRFREAAAASANLLLPGTQSLGIAPPLLELSQQAGDFGAYLKIAAKNNDLLSYAQGKLGQASGS